jgi:ParB family chromosome partitioning protein
MARKNLLAGLTGMLPNAAGSPQLPDGNSAASPASEPLPKPSSATPHFGIGGTRGAIGAVSRSIEQLKQQSVVEIDPAQIEVSFISDRLEGSAEPHDSLVQSIREHGQQVPILVRPHPGSDGRYQVVYGHRRLKAVAEIGRPVRAVVKVLTDEQAIIAQGQENSQRTDLSFIERALFAARLEARGFARDAIMAALAVDKTGLSRLISAAVKVPEDVIRAIGPAPKAGRDRWIELASRLERAGAVEAVRREIAHAAFPARDTDERFVRVFNAAMEKKPARPKPTVLKGADGTRYARLKTEAESLTVTIDDKTTPGFGAYLAEALPDLYAAFKARGRA